MVFYKVHARVNLGVQMPYIRVAVAQPLAKPSFLPLASPAHSFSQFVFCGAAMR